MDAIHLRSDDVLTNWVWSCPQASVNRSVPSPAQTLLPLHGHLSPLRGDSIRTNLPSMRHMVVLVPELTGLRLDQIYRGELALCEPTHRPRQIHGAAGCEATRGRYRMPPPAGTACAVDAIPSQAGSEMPIRQGARQAPAPPLPASTAEGDAQPRHCALRWTRAPTLGQIEG